MFPFFYRKLYKNTIGKYAVDRKTCPDGEVLVLVIRPSVIRPFAIHPPVIRA
jgi:hypothetical protein